MRIFLIGYVIVSCFPGFVVDSISSGIYRCDNGIWTPRPFCTSKRSPFTRDFSPFCSILTGTNQCSLADLTGFIGNSTLANGLTISQQQLSTSSEGSDRVLIGSFMLFTCRSGYQNIDNNLNVTCTASGQWSAFPSCIPISTTTSGSKVLSLRSILV